MERPSNLRGIRIYAKTFTPKEDREKPEDEQRTIPFLTWRDVFNVEQTENLPERLSQLPKPTPLPEALEYVETFLARIGAKVLHGGSKAFYAPRLDLIILPEPAWFESAPHYYATSLHEHGHWTGHPSRLNRDLTERFGTEAYAGEELVAELAAAYLAALLGIPGKLQHAEYIGNWIALLIARCAGDLHRRRKSNGSSAVSRSAGGPCAGEDRERGNQRRVNERKFLPAFNATPAFFVIGCRVPWSQRVLFPLIIVCPVLADRVSSRRCFP